MNIRTIEIRNKLDSKKLGTNLSKFFRTTKFNAQYVFIQVKLITNEGKKEHILNNKFPLNLNNKPQIFEFINTIKTNLIKIENSIKIIKNEKIIINYIKTNKVEYDKFILQIANLDKFNF